MEGLFLGPNNATRLFTVEEEICVSDNKNRDLHAILISLSCFPNGMSLASEPITE